MRTCDAVRCRDFPCKDVKRACHVVPSVELRTANVRAVMVSEAAPAARADYFYAGPEALFARTTVQAFQESGAHVSRMKDILRLGVYVTTAVKCGKTGYGIKTGTIKECSHLLEQELALFPKLKVLLLMGDVAIKAVNEIARRAGEPRVIPAGSTYKLRGKGYEFHGVRVFPSYLQAGSSFFIEKGKRKMVAEDIRRALAILGGTARQG